MKPLFLFIFITISLLVLASFTIRSNNREPFDEVGDKIHVKLNKKCQPEYYSYQQPSGNGELGCTQVPCPDGYSDRMVCWDCCNFH